MHVLSHFLCVRVFIAAAWQYFVAWCRLFCYCTCSIIQMFKQTIWTHYSTRDCSSRKTVITCWIPCTRKKNSLITAISRLLCLHWVQRCTYECHSELISKYGNETCVHFPWWQTQPILFIGQVKDPIRNISDTTRPMSLDS